MHIYLSRPVLQGMKGETPALLCNISSRYFVWYFRTKALRSVQRFVIEKLCLSILTFLVTRVCMSELGESIAV